MSLFDQNQWYQILVKSFGEDLDMVGFAPQQPKRAAPVFFSNSNTSEPASRWQIIPSVNDSYIFRSEHSGPTVYLSIRQNTTTESEIGGSTAIMQEFEDAGNEVFWKLGTYNGGFSMKNSANDSSWNLLVKEKATMAMTHKIQENKDGQTFDFKKLGKIDDQKFSSVPVS